MSDLSRSTDDEEFQASSEDIDIKPWDLPYWRGAPKKDKKELEETQEEEVEVVEPITVEELEKIRNEGYEEGFLQGLNEGREKGEKEGYEKGLVEGTEEGNKQGQQEGNRIGFDAGHAEGMSSGQNEISAAAQHLSDLSIQLNESLKERDVALPKVLSQLIQTACETIIERELLEGDTQITQKVTAALDQLPSGSENTQIYISAIDAPHLEKGLKSSARQMDFKIDDSLTTGSARITTTQSLIEFSHAERMKEVFQYIDMQCEKLDLTAIDGEKEEFSDDMNREVNEIVESNSDENGVAEESGTVEEQGMMNEQASLEEDIKGERITLEESEFESRDLDASGEIEEIYDEESSSSEELKENTIEDSSNEP